MHRSRHRIGQIEMMISGLSSGMPFVKRKQLKLLAVSSAKRVSLVPDVPTMAETLPGYDVGSWYAVLATAGTPRAVIDKLSQASIAAVTTPDDPVPAGRAGHRRRTDESAAARQQTRPPNTSAGARSSGLRA